MEANRTNNWQASRRRGCAQSWASSHYYLPLITIRSLSQQLHSGHTIGFRLSHPHTLTRYTALIVCQLCSPIQMGPESIRARLTWGRGCFEMNKSSGKLNGAHVISGGGRQAVSGFWCADVNGPVALCDHWGAPGELWRRRVAATSSHLARAGEPENGPHLQTAARARAWPPCRLTALPVDICINPYLEPLT